ncbi:hypothetical protein [Stenotrophomonas sp. PS02301]|uniref:hypothetical protein n=1 Tax=Stenotrophomonas sp. PS02301 TaxID=2991427 RepID=UPI00249A8753|nr:hypothetical protein [Stenotrophomonas sp. PS02301]
MHLDQHHYSLMRGGLVHRLLLAAGMLRGTARLSLWIAVALVVISLAPLVVMTARAGTLWTPPPGMPLLGDYATLARVLLAMPLLVLAAPRSDTLLRNAFRQLTRAGLVPPQRQERLAALLAKVRRWRDGWLPEALCVVIAWLPLLFGTDSVSLLPGVADWRLEHGALTAAGRWYEWVAVPLFRLVALLWLWRFVLWTGLLWRLPRVGLALHAEHPDGAGGLAFLGMAQERFAVLALAGGILVAGACVNHVHYLGESLYDLRHLLAGYVIGATLLLVAPLLVMMPSMMRAKRHALYRFDALGNRAAALFDQRWRSGSRQGADADSLLDHGDASAFADFSGVYKGLASMSVLPLNRWNLLWIALHAIVPLLPLVLLAMSVDELARKLLGILV